MFQKKNNLFTLLPPPQHTNIKKTNKTLIPHTLTKKQPTTPTPKPSTRPSKKKIINPAKPNQKNNNNNKKNQPSNFFSFKNNNTHTISKLSSKKLSLPPPIITNKHLISKIIKPSINISQNLTKKSILKKNINPQNKTLQFRTSYSSTQKIYQPHITKPIPIKTSITTKKIKQKSNKTKINTYITLPFPPLYNLTTLFKYLKYKFTIIYLIIKNFFSILKIFKYTHI